MMKSVGELIVKQTKLILDNKQHAIFCAVFLSVLPFACWLSAALVGLVVLRKGPKLGFEVMLPALVIHSVPLMMMMSLDNVLLNTLIAYLPCYLGAIALRKTTSWQSVFAVFLIEALVVFLIIQGLAPDFATDQLEQIKKLFSQYPEYQEALEQSIAGLEPYVAAQLFFGLQVLGIIISALFSLMFARSVQAKLFLPGGFSKEVLEFRGTRLAFMSLITVFLAAYTDNAWAINLLPMMICYFLAAGFGLVYFVFARKRQIAVSIMLLLLIVIKPSFVLFVYVVFGSLDSLFNFRLYLKDRVNQSV